jgi:hypothetical protein
LPPRSGEAATRHSRQENAQYMQGTLSGSDVSSQDHRARLFNIARFSSPMRPNPKLIETAAARHQCGPYGPRIIAPLWKLSTK